MTHPDDNRPDLTRLRGVVAPEILIAAEVASTILREAGVPHALLVGDEAFEKHVGGLVTLKVPLIAVGSVRVDFLSIDEARGEKEPLRSAVETPSPEGQVPVAQLAVLIYLKLKASRQKDVADLVELLKRGRVDVEDIARYLAKYAPALVRKWEHVKKVAAEEE